MSRRAPLMHGRLLATGLWPDPTRAAMAELLRRLLGTAGDPQRERLFRMNITLCLHRACTPEEVAGLPSYFHQDPPTDLAGGPVEVLWESEAGAPSTQPCLAPHRQALDPRDRLLWIPLDCGSCPSCRARLAYRASLPSVAGGADAP